ncbi:coiled-coil domain-containing protein [Flavobacterium sangjuense]|uniref:Outer membrane protein beta-barrel domain-containing protein n=1 Tax=Flavobacterium sangjuense TaxID=2518177 RepID=A0A4P7PPV4_9FLAO|nr:hypothetical protein [Flavobacterium sangjuense]QBZ96738.1 hypothetical protein GS03_00217 [Flavobacterium sangjuense]
MKNFTLYLAVAACLVASKLSAQETFEDKAKAIAVKIENITKEEKAALKVELETVNKDLENNVITKAQADQKKLELAEIRSKNIETRISQAQEELKDLVKQKVDGKIAESYNHDRFVISFSKHKTTEKYKRWKDSIRNASERRTTTQFVFAAGVNNLVTDKAVAHSDYRYWGSHFYEWGFTSNTRLFKNDNLLHLKYGFSVMYNNLRPTDNRLFVVNGDQTNLETSSVNLKDSRFRNVYVTLPVHLEFDFTKTKTNAEGKKIFRTHEGVRFGIGGYAGFRVKSKQILKFSDEGHDVTVKEKGGFNTNDFIYGVSTYLGYGATSLYLKYDLNPLFKDNAVKQNNISLGVRFDLN